MTKITGDAMDGYYKKEFHLRQKLCVYLGFRNIFIICILLMFLPSEEELRYELETPAQGLIVIAICLALLLTVVGCIYSKLFYIVLGAVDLAIFVFLSLYMDVAGFLIGLIFSLHFIVYLLRTKAYKQERDKQFIYEAMKESEKYQNEHQGIFNDEEEK